MTESSAPSNTHNSSASLLWTPSASRRNGSRLTEFATRYTQLNLEPGDFRRYDSLHKWSIEDLSRFWRRAAEYLEVCWHKPPAAEGPVWCAAGAPEQKLIRNGRWFPNTSLNFAENLLTQVRDSTRAITSHAEGRAVPDVWSGGRLYRAVFLCAEALSRSGIGKGDRVAGVVSNVPEAIVAMLATTSLGAIWSSCSPDFGQQAILDRFDQIGPKALFFTRSYIYAGKRIDSSKAIAQCLDQLPTVQIAVGIDHLDGQPVVGGSPSDFRAIFSWSEFLGKDPRSLTEAPIRFQSCDFNDPLFILFSSGTTGVPKCIVHSVGGTLLQHKKELALHCDLRRGDRLLYFTTCGWMMWNWMVSALSLGVDLVLFDGAPHLPTTETLWRLVDEEGVTAFGTSPKFLATTMSQDLAPKGRFAFKVLRTILSTGSPLLPEHFRWVYESVKSDVHLASISGGTDIVSCFMLGNPWNPVHAGEIQGPGLGMAVEAWDEDGRGVSPGVRGELVCTKPFVSMPVSFWNDPDGEKYRRAYFDFFLNHPRGEVWRHGDFVSISETGGITVYGRSDATLNPGGVRIGTAELYRVVESDAAVADSVAIGAPAPGGDVRVVLFVKLRGQDSTPDLTAWTSALKKTIRQTLSPRHVPDEVFIVQDIPYTRSGKKMELAVLAAFTGQEIKNFSSLANPECIGEYSKLALRSS